MTFYKRFLRNKSRTKTPEMCLTDALDVVVTLGAAVVVLDGEDVDSAVSFVLNPAASDEPDLGLSAFSVLDCVSITSSDAVNTVVAKNSA